MIGGLLASGLTLVLGTADASDPTTQTRFAALSGVVDGACVDGESSAGPTAEELAARAAEAAGSALCSNSSILMAAAVPPAGATWCRSR
jgi:hypothetical protein